jgi:putative membrane protein
MQEQQLGEGQIINIMMAVDKGEIAAAQQATQKKVSPAVDLYAKYLIQQHQRNLEELTQLAKQLRLEPQESAISTSLVNNGKHDLKAQDELQDNAFDKAFIAAMIKDHQAGLELIDTKLIPQTKNPQLKVFVEQFRKMVAEHLEKGREVQKTL